MTAFLKKKKKALPVKEFLFLIKIVFHAKCFQWRVTETHLTKQNSINLKH